MLKLTLNVQHLFSLGAWCKVAYNLNFSSFLANFLDFYQQEADAIKS